MGRAPQLGLLAKMIKDSGTAAALEGVDTSEGGGTMLFASGMAAISATLLSLVRAGEFERAAEFARVALAPSAARTPSRNTS